MIKLYKIEKNEIKFVDYGVKNKSEDYAAQGYIVIEK